MQFFSIVIIYLGEELPYYKLLTLNWLFFIFILVKIGGRVKLHSFSIQNIIEA